MLIERKHKSLRICLSAAPSGFKNLFACQAMANRNLKMIKITWSFRLFRTTFIPICPMKRSLLTIIFGFSTLCRTLYNWSNLVTEIFMPGCWVMVWSQHSVASVSVCRVGWFNRAQTARILTLRDFILEKCHNLSRRVDIFVFV